MGGITVGNNALDIFYSYDIRGQLLEERRNGASVCYAYDKAGNRILKADVQGDVRYLYNEKNQLLIEEGIGEKKQFSYDRQGGIIEEKGSAGIRLFSYNGRHQQTKVKTEKGDVQENHYDAEGLRFELLENGRRTSFVYHDGELLHEERREENQTSYHPGVGIDAFQRGQRLSYYHRDEQLSTALIISEHGEIQNSYQYDAFGAEVEATEQFSNRSRYTGQQYDELTGQYYLRARYYNPVLGRFMQEDTYWGDGLNLYVYCGNNPVIYCDPSGFTALTDEGYFVYGLFDSGTDTPYYIGITNDVDRRRQEHINTGRLNVESTEKYPVVGELNILKEDVTYGQARGYEQFYIEEYDTRHGVRGIGGPSQDNRQNINNSYDTNRTDDRAMCFNETYNRMKEEKSKMNANNEENTYGGENPCKK